jgi:hypothetical protein
MKAAVIVCRNDNYGDNLHHRARLCLNNLCEVFDKIYVVDWKCVDGISLVEACGIVSPKIENIKILNEMVSTNWPMSKNLPMVETIGRNIGIRSAINDNIDWICSTNIDIMMNTFDEHILSTDTLYTVRKYSVPEHIHLQRDITIAHLNEHKYEYEYAKLAVIDGRAVWDDGDVWSMVVGCGDFQLAHASLWMRMKGFEDSMVGRSYADSNIMKKAVLCGGNAEVLGVNIFHLNHSSNAYRSAEETSIPINDRILWVNDFTASQNEDSWGLLTLKYGHTTQ